MVNSNKSKKTHKKSRRKIRAILFNILLLILIFLAAFLILVERWTFTTWASLQIGEIIYQLTNPIGGTAGEIMNGFYFGVLLPALVVTALAGIFFLWWLPRRKRIRHIRGVICIISLCLIAGAVAVGWRTLGIGTWIQARNTDSAYIEDNYVDPSDVSITFPEKKRNLIYIFLESMEVTYTDRKDGGAFSDDYIPELTGLAEKNEDFSGDSTALNGGISPTNTTWTIAAMFAQTSGLPLQVSVDTNSYSFDHYFPNMTALGDILEKEGYDQTLLLGSGATFASRDVYFTDHGSYHIEDYYSMLADGRLPKGYNVWWGYEDEKLFQFAKEDLAKIGNSGKPFNYTMLTADTHFPDGYVCDLCRDDYGDNQYANVIACSSRQVADFVSWVQEQPWYENTTIVISGDHPTMDGNFCKGIDSSYQRSVYTCYINAAAEPDDPDRRREFTTLDDFPTTLAAMGAEIDGDRLGLGTNLFSDTDTLLERDGLETMNAEFSGHSEFMDNMAAINADDLKEVDQFHNEQVEYTVKPQDDGTVAITMSGFSDLSSDISYFYLNIYNREDTDQSTQIEASANGDGTYTAIFDPAASDLPEDDAYLMQADVWSSVGETTMGEQQLVQIR